MAMSMASVPSCSCAVAATATAGGSPLSTDAFVYFFVVRLKSSKDITPWYSESVSCSQKNWRHHHVRRRYMCGVVDFGKVVTMAEIGSMTPAIVLTEKALKHLNKLRADQNKDLCL